MTAFEGSFDVLGGVMYIIVFVLLFSIVSYHIAVLTLNSSIVMEGGIYVCHIIWRIRHRRLIKEAKAAGKTVDEMLEFERKESEGPSESGASIFTTGPGDLESHGASVQGEKEQVVVSEKQ